MSLCVRKAGEMSCVTGRCVLASIPGCDLMEPGQPSHLLSGGKGSSEFAAASLDHERPRAQGSLSRAPLFLFWCPCVSVSVTHEGDLGLELHKCSASLLLP